MEWNENPRVQMLVPVLQVPEPSYLPYNYHPHPTFTTQPAPPLHSTWSFMDFITSDDTFPSLGHEGGVPLVERSAHHVMGGSHTNYIPIPLEYPAHEQSQNNTTFSESTRIINRITSKDFEDTESKKEELQKKVSPTCGICGKQFFSAFNVRRHTKVVHSNEKPSFPCRHCGKDFKRGEYRQLHEKACPKNKDPGCEKYRCEICGSTFTRSHHLSRHIANKHSSTGGTVSTDSGTEGTVSTDSGTGGTVSKDSKTGGMVANKRSNTGGMVRQCPHCDYKTPYTHVLQKHVYRYHGSDSGLFVCKTCGVDFRTDYGMGEHRKRGCQGSPHTNTLARTSTLCRICSVNLKTANALVAHLGEQHHGALVEFLVTNEDETGMFSGVGRERLLEYERKPAQLLSEGTHPSLEILKLL